MSTSRNSLAILAIAGFIGTVLYFQNVQPESKSASESVRESGDTTEPAVVPKQFAGYDCTVDCSGHEAGYKWAQEQDIKDGGDCDAAGEHSNSPSFAEGCHAYVDGESEPDNANDPETDE